MAKENNHFRSDPRRQDNHLCDFVPIDQAGESIGEGRDRRQKENAQDAEKFLEKQCKEGASRAKFARLEPEKAGLTAWARSFTKR